MRTLTKCPRCSSQIAGWVVRDFEITHCVMCGFVLEDRTRPLKEFEYKSGRHLVEDDIPVAFTTVFPVKSL